MKGGARAFDPLRPIAGSRWWDVQEAEEPLPDRRGVDRRGRACGHVLR